MMKIMRMIDNEGYLIIKKDNIKRADITQEDVMELSTSQELIENEN